MSTSGSLSLRWVIGLPVLAAVLLYLPVLWAGFVYDDVQLLERNPFVRSWSNLFAGFAVPFWDITEQAVNMTSFYRPLGVSAFVTLYKLGGGEPFLFHLASLLFHAASTLLLVRLALALGLSKRSALVCGLIFALHGAHVEAVAWVSALPDLMAACFALAALLAAAQERWRGAMLWLLFAMLCKESAYGIWLALIGVTVLWGGAQRWPRLAWLGGIGVVVFALRVWAFDSALGGLDIRNTYHFLEPFTQTLLGLSLLAQHLAFLVWPFPHAPYHPLRVDHGPGDLALAGPALIGFALALAGLALWLLRGGRSPLLRYAPALLFAPLAPVLNTTLLGQFPFEERFNYLASGGAALLLGAALVGAADRRPRGHLALALVIGVLGVHLWSTATTMPKWNNEAAHYAWGKVASPFTMRPYLNEARLQLEEAQTYPVNDPRRLELAELAFQNYDTAVQIDSNKWFVSQIDREQGNVGQGDAHFVLGDFRNAEAIYRETLKGYPKAPYAHLGLGHCLTRMGEQLGQQGQFEQARPLWEEGLSHYRAAITIEASLWSGWHGVAVCLAFLGRNQDAITPAEEAFRRAPQDFEVCRTLAELQLLQSWPARALTTYQTFLAQNPDHPQAPQVHQITDFLQQLAQAQAAFSAAPADFGAARALAAIQEAAGMLPEARQTYRLHLQAAPDSAFADRVDKELRRLKRLEQSMRAAAGG